MAIKNLFAEDQDGEHPFDDLRKKQGKNCTADDVIEAVSQMDNEQRHHFYEQCAKAALVRYLIEEQLEKDIDPINGQDECELIEDGEGQTDEGVMYIMKVRGSFWRVVLERDEIFRKAIEQNPQLVNDPALFMMKLKKGKVKFKCLNGRFYRDPQFNS